MDVIQNWSVRGHDQRSEVKGVRDIADLHQGNRSLDPQLPIRCTHIWSPVSISLVKPGQVVDCNRILCRGNSQK